MIEREELLTIIPHKGKMVLINRVNNYNLEERTIEAEYDVTDDCIFYDEQADGIPSWTGFECIAQAISAFSVIRNKTSGIASKFGFILSVSQLCIEIPYLKAGSSILIKTKEIEDLSPVFVFHGEIFSDNKKVLSGRLTVMDVDEEQAKTVKKESN